MKLPSGVSRVAARQLLLLKKNSPNIMFATGIVGGVTATVMACKATLKLEQTLLVHEEDRQLMEERLADLNDSYQPEQYAKDDRTIKLRVVRDVAKLYAPSVGVGVVSIGLLTGAHITLTKRNAALAAAYGVLDKAFREYRDRVKDELGEDREREIYVGAKDVEVVGEDGKTTTAKRASGAHSPYARIFDENNRRWAKNDMLSVRSFLQAQQNYLNDLLQARGHVFLNDAYDTLGMERSVAGSVVGWVKNNGDNFIDFGLFHSTDPVMRDFMMLEDTSGIMIDFNVDGVVTDLIGREF